MMAKIITAAEGLGMEVGGSGQPTTQPTPNYGTSCDSYGRGIVCGTDKFRETLIYTVIHCLWN